MSDNKVDNEAIYEENWAAWESSKVIGPMSRHTRRLIFEQCKRASFASVLDIGCGPGVFLAELSRRYPEVQVAGVDISASAIDLAQKRNPKAHLQVHDITKAPLTGSFDLVTMVDVAEHIGNDTAAFRNIAACCHGRLIVATLEGRMRPFEPSVGHVRNYRPGELRQKLIDAGYEVSTYRNWGWPMFSPFYRNLTGIVDSHRGRIGLVERVMAQLIYGVLGMNVPGKGDLVVVVAEPKSIAEAIQA